MGIMQTLSHHNHVLSIIKATPSQVHSFIQHTLRVGDYYNWGLVLHVHNWKSQSNRACHAYLSLLYRCRNSNGFITYCRNALIRCMFLGNIGSKFDDSGCNWEDLAIPIDRKSNHKRKTARPKKTDRGSYLLVSRASHNILLGRFTRFKLELTGYLKYIAMLSEN